MVVVVRLEEVPKDLICAICMSVPLKPKKLRQCGHVFCDECIQESLAHQRQCPVLDRRSCNPATDVKALREGSLGYRIWSTIEIKCDHHEAGCSWRGSISDYFAHRNLCRQGPFGGDRRSRSDQRLIDNLETEKILLSERVEDVVFENGRLRAELERISTELLQRQREVEELKSTNQQMKVKEGEIFNAMMTILQLPKENSKGGYDYSRHSVVKLTKLICQHLENKPDNIKANKIYECVTKIYGDLDKNHFDEPAFLYMDVRMLFGVCLASTWFSDNQRRQLSRLAGDKGWL
ncbi:TNF receptor-associated factor [Seminavis robusta]|uniref:TNF receptor-associated factor n=1 Tax=Seminavis robusta TaxID=568900 RepID=A0A9N8DQ66_9STRA|nr:TNF receptor-associated factor [Seminavis robusta]|eukprot:Sro276_g105930.1 TNF receptor-associated factor (292) ;mRNA; r:22119-22994